MDEPFNDPLNDPRFPKRPATSEFWRLSEIVLQLDASFKDARSEGNDNELWAETLGRFIDANSLAYFAHQRVLRALQIETREEALEAKEMIIIMMQCYIDAFIIGCSYMERGQEAK